jgi:hypothetical protein
MNLATLVSSIVLAASTATAGLLVAPPSFHAAQDGSGLQVGPLCVGVCGNETGNQTYPGGNETLPTPFGNSSSPPPEDNETAPPSDDGAAEAESCGVDIQDSQEMTGPTSLAWSWAVGASTTNLSVSLDVQGVWMPLGGGLHIRLTDGEGNVVATSDGGGMSLPFDFTAISYQGDASTGLSRGVWHLTVDANGLFGSSWLDVHSEC